MTNVKRKACGACLSLENILYLWDTPSVKLVFLKSCCSVNWKTNDPIIMKFFSACSSYNSHTMNYRSDHHEIFFCLFFI